MVLSVLFSAELGEARCDFSITISFFFFQQVQIERPDGTAAIR